MKYLPCKKDKCISYPSCVSKTSIDCDSLRRYYQYYKNERNVKGSTVWRAVTTVLPQLSIMDGFKSLDGRYSYHRQRLPHGLENLQVPIPKRVRV